MKIQEFIFSEKRNDRIKQHLLFWGIWYPYITLTHAAFPFGYPEMAYFKNPVIHLPKVSLLYWRKFH